MVSETETETVPDRQQRESRPNKPTEKERFGRNRRHRNYRGSLWFPLLAARAALGSRSLRLLSPRYHQ